jgi:hypothetical protein
MFPAGIGLRTWQVNPLEGTRLGDSHGRKEKQTHTMKDDAYLTAHMKRRRTHVIFASRVSFDLWVRIKPLSIECVVVSTNFCTLRQTTSPSG